jgi:hypothetical protein
MRNYDILNKEIWNQFFREERNRGVVMKKFAVLLPVVFLIAFVSASYAQSLDDLARQEKERREEVKSNRVITDEDVAKYTKESRTTTAPAEPPQSPAQPEQQEGAQANNRETGEEEADEPTDFEGRPESFWRKTMAEARQRVKDLTNEANVLVLKIADLQNKFYSMDDGFKREDIQREVQKSYYEQDLNKQNLEKAKAAVQDLENEARKSGALPGWIAPGNP